MKRGKVKFLPFRTEVRIVSIDIDVNGGMFGTTLDLTVTQAASGAVDRPLLCIPMNERMTTDLVGKIRPGDFIVIHSVFGFIKREAIKLGPHCSDRIIISEDPVVFKVEKYEPKKSYYRELRAHRKKTRKKMAARRGVLPRADKKRVRKKK